MKQHLIRLSCLLTASALTADVSLNRLFSDGMVIQRETNAPIWS